MDVLRIATTERELQTKDEYPCIHVSAVDVPASMERCNLFQIEDNQSR